MTDTPPGERSPGPAEPAETLGLERHDHADCVRRVMEEVAALEARGGLNLTPVRRRVLELLLESHAAVGAYDLLARLGEEKGPTQPPVVYRALDYLMRHGLVHRIERLNAYVACVHPEESHSPAFMICRVCNAVAEGRAAPQKGKLGRMAQAAGFRIERTVVEALGVCAACDRAEREA